MSTSSHLTGKLAISTLALCCLANALPAVPAPQTNPSRPNEDISAIGHRTVGKGVNLYSLEREQKLGEQLNKEVERAARLLDDPVVTEYVDRIVQKIALNSDARIPITMRVIDSDVPDGFTMPGGFQYNSSRSATSDAQPSTKSFVVAVIQIGGSISRFGVRTPSIRALWNSPCIVSCDSFTCSQEAFAAFLRACST